MEENKNIDQSIEFAWTTEEFPFLLESCKRDDAIKLSLKYIKNKDLKILEAGCGSGRFVKYLSDLGFKNTCGIELNQKIIREQNKNFPELKICHGNILDMPYEDNFFDVVVCYGVIEHFPNGMDAPLHSIFKVMKPGGIAIITVPSLNTLRQIKHFLNKLSLLSLKENNYIRKILNKPPVKRSHNYLYHVYPNANNFFEYRLKPGEFEDICTNAGFEILESTPISHIDGLYHESSLIFRKHFLPFNNWSFKISKTAFFINALLKKINFFHNHMHACVLKKP